MKCSWQREEQYLTTAIELKLERAEVETVATHPEMTMAGVSRHALDGARLGQTTQGVGGIPYPAADLRHPLDHWGGAPLTVEGGGEIVLIDHAALGAIMRRAGKHKHGKLLHAVTTFGSPSPFLKY